jgi:hypothetical protein
MQTITNRFWADGNIAMAMNTFAYLFPSVPPPAGL